MTDGPTDIIREGTTELLVYNKKVSHRGPGVRATTPFYNPSMELNRDLSLLVNQWFLNISKQQVHILDGLAASGIRGIRLAHELTGNFIITLNDLNDQSISLIHQNIQKNSLQNIAVFQRDLNGLLSERRYHSIDIDPFGSPVYFLDAAVRSVYDNGIIACTATDTATLCGVFPQVCYRRYSAWPLHGPCMHEVGIRILLGCLCREAAKYDRGIEPLLCYTTDHYMRLLIHVKNGKRAANQSMHHFSTLSSKEVPHSTEKTTLVGPLWLGKLQKKSVLQAIRALVPTRVLNTAPQLKKLLLLLEEEADSPPFFYTTNDLSSLLKQSPPPIEYILERLRTKGYLATRTHFTPTGFKTNAPLNVITEVFK